MSYKQTQVEENIYWCEQITPARKKVWCGYCKKFHKCPGSTNHKPTVTTFYRVMKVIGKMKFTGTYNPKKYGGKKGALQAARNYRNSLKSMVEQ